jgi:hypothetical protein
VTAAKVRDLRITTVGWVAELPESALVSILGGWPVGSSTPCQKPHAD